MKRHFILFIVGFTTIVIWIPAIWARDPDFNSLVFKRFDEHGNKTEAISKLEDIVFKTFREQQDGYIQLFDNEFIVFASNTGRAGLGLYLVDLSTHTISTNPFASGASELILTLKDKSGNDYLLLHHSYPMHGGYAGGSYSLMSARKSSRGKAIIDLIELGTYVSVSEEIGNICEEKDNAERILNEDAAYTITDINKDGYPDIKMTLKQLNCNTGKTKISKTNLLASSRGFKSVSTKNPQAVGKKLFKAQKQALEEFSRTKNQQTAARILEEANVGQFLYEKPVGISTAAYAAILNDFAFYIGPWRVMEAVDILDRVIKLSPDRAVAYLNRAELQSLMLSFGYIKTQYEKITVANEIMKDYSTYNGCSR